MASREEAEKLGQALEEWRDERRGVAERGE